MNVTITTPFRNNERHVPKYIFQAGKLDWPKRQLRWVLAEGDSTDATLQMLTEWAGADKRVTVVKCDTGKPHYGSIVHPERFEILAHAFNTALEGAIADEWSDYNLFIPSDVLYKPDLIKRLMGWDKDVISPMFWIGPHEGDPVQNANGMRFYDIWGFIRDGQPLPPNGPAWYAAHYPQEPVQMDTTGGVMLYKAEIARAGARYTITEVDHGFCKEARKLGYTVWCDPTTHVVHGER